MRQILAVAAAIFLAANLSSAQTTHVYMGTKKCSMCHKGEAKGAVFEKWQASAHAKAFTDLASSAALEVYKKKMGKEGNPQTDAACLKCHITAFGADTTLTAALVKEEGVTCEACHGAGADFGKMNVMKDRNMALAAGMVAEPKAGCVKCHNPESPTYKEFKIETYWSKIAHAVPKAVPAP